MPVNRMIKNGIVKIAARLRYVTYILQSIHFIATNSQFCMLRLAIDLLVINRTGWQQKRIFSKTSFTANTEFLTPNTRARFYIIRIIFFLFARIHSFAIFLCVFSLLQAIKTHTIMWYLEFKMKRKNMKN